MSRVLKKRRKRYTGLPEDRALKQEHSLQSAADKCEKILRKSSNNNNSCDLENEKRLAGGADNAEDPEVISSVSLEPEEQSEETGGDAPASNDTDSVSKPLSEKNVNEMIDDVIEHLQEAGKALAALSGDHEHDLKLMLVDVIAKLQTKVDEVQRRVDSGINELNELRKQLISRTNELEELKTKLAEAETMKVSYEKALAENELKLAATDAASTPVQSAHTPGLSDPMSSVTTPGPQEKSQADAEGLASQLSSKIASELRLDGSIKIPSGFAALSSGSPVEIHGTLQRDVSGKIQGSFHGNIQGSSPGSIRGSFIGNNMEIIEKDGQDSSQRSQAASGLRVGGSSSPSALRSSREAPSTIPIEQLADQDGNRHYEQSERKQRQSELENECERLRRENEKILKERADYENAIQRAVLKGVSSLNVETLKVLKNPPISCCTPCPPCNEETESTTATNILCPKIVRDSWCPRDKSMLSTKLDCMLKQKEKSSYCIKQQAPSVCYSSRIDNKASQDSMIFVLPQKTETCSQYPRFRARPNSAEPKSICTDNKYRKPSSKERNYFSGRAQKSGNQDACPVSIRDYSRTLNCNDIFATASRYDSRDAKRCDPCSRIRRIFDD